MKSQIDTYTLDKLLGKGSFGQLWLGLNSRQQKVALKFEKEDSPTPTILIEFNFYRMLGNHKYLPHVFDLLGFDSWSCLVMQLLGKSLENRMDYCQRKMPIKDVIQVSIQLIDLMEFLHSKSIIHRDVKPENFLFGRRGHKSENQLHIIDLGLAKQFRDDTGIHVEYKANAAPMGTARYMSIRAHMAVQQSRRDDLESVAYVLIYLQRDRMPWDGLFATEKDARARNVKIQMKKQSTPTSELIRPDIPSIFAQLLEYTRKLKFKEDPDYNRMRSLFTDYAKKMNIKMDGKFSWTGKGDDDSDIEIKPQINSNAKQKYRSKQK